MSPRTDPRLTCPNRAKHTECPTNYLGWHEWAEKKAKTHEQVKCEGCGRLSIWIPKRKGKR